MTIKHLVFSGGGPVGFINYGIIKQLTIEKVIEYNNIKSIYSTSIGSIIAIIYILNFEWSWIDDYLIKRPWQNLINFSSYDYINLIYTKGMLNENFFKEIFKPLFLAKDIDINITLKEFYELTNIELHIFGCNLNKFCKVDFNHNTYPDLELYKAIIMSCSIPILVEPIYYNDEYFLDGGMFANTPLNECLNDQACDESEVFACISDKRYPIDDISYSHTFNTSNPVDKDINIFYFLIHIFRSIFNKLMVFENENLRSIKNSINIAINLSVFDINYWLYFMNNEDERERLIDLGKIEATKFINTNIITDCSHNYDIEIDCSNIYLITDSKN